MVTATHDDITRLFPGIDDHTALEILATGTTVVDLEAAMVMLSDDNVELIAVKPTDSDLLVRLVNILGQSELNFGVETER